MTDPTEPAHLPRPQKKDETSDPVDTQKQYARVKGSLLPVVLVLRGATPKPFYVLGVKENTVGRGEGNVILLDDAGCSRNHFCLVYENADTPNRVPVVRLEDRGSRNGTFLNGAMVTEPMRLKFGDRIQAGNTIMCFVIRSLSEVEAEGRASKPEGISPDLQANRVAVHCPARLTLNLPDQTGTPMKIDGQLEDVSISGVRFRSNQPPQQEQLEALRPMRTARLWASLPGSDDEVIDATGRIAWIHRDSSACVNLGLEIHGISPKAHDALMRYIVANS